VHEDGKDADYGTIIEKDDDEDAAYGEEEDKVEEVQSDDKDATNGATSENDMLAESMQGNEAEEDGANFNTGF
jgi:hypothetical protein